MGLAFWPGSNPQPKLGCWVLPSCLPSRPISFTKSPVPLMSKIAPEALLTSGSSATFVCSDSGTVDLAAPLTISLPEITAPVSSYVPANRSSKAFFIVSVRTKVPLTIATPRTIDERSERRAQLAPHQALQRRRGHRCLRLSIMPSTAASSSPLTSSTVLPSARKTIRSATAAALASCVTIIVVWP